MVETENSIEQIQQLLRKQSTLSLATVSEDGLPYVTPLFYIADDSCCLYWFSSASSLHSVHGEINPRAAVTVYGDVEQWEMIRGVQMQGIVAQVKERERRKELTKQYVVRFNLGNIFRMALKASNLYAFQPNHIRYIDNNLGFGYKREIALPAF
jgi:uncharacterized protein YhbP (UPF0306 family)